MCILHTADRIVYGRSNLCITEFYNKVDFDGPGSTLLSQVYSSNLPTGVNVKQLKLFCLKRLRNGGMNGLLFPGLFYHVKYTLSLWKHSQEDS